MSAPTAPAIPPRPVRAQAASAAGANKLPELPPRPTNKSLERSVSPSNYPRSPFNEPYNPLGKVKSNDASLQKSAIPRRPSVQNLPSVGQEGSEYGEIHHYRPDAPTSALGVDAAAQTRSVSHDLPIHAPKPSLPASSAQAHIKSVTRTDSQTAAAHGFGKPDTPMEGDVLGRVRSRASFSRPASGYGGERRPSSAFNEEQGPATLGMRVPINPLLGDVQAPSPAPGLSPAHTGQNGEKKPNHFRRQSGRDSLPPGSYGLHGHGLAPADPFERDWYSKHPDQLQHEEESGHGVYESIGSGRGSFAMSSDELNKLVRQTASRGSGFGRRYILRLEHC